MTSSPYAQVDASYPVMDWLNSLADLKTKLTSTVHGKSRTGIYMAMPTSFPLPLLVFGQVAGGMVGNDFVVQQARISFDIFASTRFQAADVKDCLVSHIEALGPTGGFSSDKGSIGDGRTINISQRLEPGRELGQAGLPIHRRRLFLGLAVTPFFGGVRSSMSVNPTI